MKWVWGLIASLLTGAIAFGQGTVLVQNLDSGLDSPVFFWLDGATRLSGTNFLAQIFVGPAGGYLKAIGDAVPFAANGYFFGGVISIPTLLPGETADAVVKVWRSVDGLTYEEAARSSALVGVSPKFSFVVGTGYSKPGYLNVPAFSFSGFQVCGGGPIPFANQGNGWDAPVFDVDGTTRLSGANFLAQLYMRVPDWLDPTGLWMRSFPEQPSLSAFSTNGYFSGQAQAFSCRGRVTDYQIRVWRASEGATFEQAMRVSGAHLGVSGFFTISSDFVTNGTTYVGLKGFALRSSAPEDYTVTFSNHGNGVDAPVFDTDGVTSLAGTNFAAQFYAGYDTATLLPEGDPVPFTTNGYFRGTNIYVGDVLADPTGFGEVRVWQPIDGPTFELAQIRPGAHWGVSAPFSILRGNGNGPLPLIGLMSFDLTNTPSLQFTEVWSAPDGSILATIGGAPGRTYVVESSNDLKIWTGIVTNTVRLNNRSQVGFDATMLTTRFYRARLP
jgi:hypothetical protein